MARLSALFLAFLLGTAGAVALASCGGGEEANLLPGTTADQIEANLNEVEELTDQGDCIGAESAVAVVAAEVEELQDVDSKLKAALEEGAAKLSEVVGRCEEDEEETEPTLETDVGAEEVEEDEKPKKEKPKDDEEPSESQEEPAEGDEGPELPPQSNGKGEEKGGGESAPPVEPEAEEAPTPSGGVGPSVGVE